ncbi:MAG: hypothetical protein AUJ88_08490 [Gallionellaceae bacterium CG1_02_56_997]|nr:MAG: hypothetical protein AUJ88_08490 [Gallionellaceae bacterium CG1_02_56_997]PIV15043.1 MAG: hypothetical protein COS43_04425 [Gallionellales bacterium CG03_land_8_20_14_0_80_55_15]PIX05163.1 MAG: hypothetical protein COZ77_02640 [Gallionellales bacterium CG_4_8_14_3_um_filter_54_18]HCJ50996.1 hypothetical protein [Gallionella sp.]
MISEKAFIRRLRRLFGINPSVKKLNFQLFWLSSGEGGHGLRICENLRNLRIIKFFFSFSSLEC